MPYDIVLTQLPAGVAVQNASGVEGALVKVAIREFTSSENGDSFIARLEGFPQLLLNLAAPQIHPSDVKQLIAVIRKDKTARVWINECQVEARIRPKRSIKKDEMLMEDDLVDIDEMRLTGVEVPADVGVLCLFSVGWRRALYFDYGPIGPDGGPRDYDLGKVLGAYMAYLHSRGVHKLTDEEWRYLIAQQWFPFVSLPPQLRSKVIIFGKGRENLDRLLPEATTSVRQSIPLMLERWRGAELLRPHIDLFAHAAKKFEEGDYLSCTAILYPRIEGLMRTVHLAVGAAGKATQKNLTNTVIDAREAEFHDFSLLSPDRFRQYLADAYFADFKPGHEAPLSRNTIGHGVATIEQFNEKGATLGLLTLDQLFFFLPQIDKSGSV